jgi:hypothetical protein
MIGAIDVLRLYVSMARKEKTLTLLYIILYAYVDFVCQIWRSIFKTWPIFDC